MLSRVGTGACLLDLLSRSRAKAEQRYGVQIKAIVIQEAGLDGFWIHRLLLANGIESHVVDAASIAVDRRHRRAKTDAIDGETLLRTLMAWARSERRVCSMVRAPSPEDEDRRRLTRERGTLLKERIQHTNRVRGLLSGQGVRDYNPLRRDRFERLEALRTGDGRELPPMLKAEIRRELDRIALATTHWLRSNAPATRSSAVTVRDGRPQAAPAPATSAFAREIGGGSGLVNENEFRRIEIELPREPFPAHKGPRVEQLIKAAGAELRYLPAYSPDMNPIEKAFSKLKAFLRKIAERAVAGLMRALETCAEIFKPSQCTNYFKSCGYEHDTG